MASERRQRRRQIHDYIAPTFVKQPTKPPTDLSWLNKSVLLMIVCSAPWFLLREKSDSDPFGIVAPVTNGISGLDVELDTLENVLEWKRRDIRRRKLNLIQSSFSDDEILKAKQSLGAVKKAYVDAGRLPQWSLRGVGYLYMQQELVLKAVFPEGTQAQAGPNVVAIYNVGKRPAKHCALLTIWVRVNGPEIFAGSAVPVTDFDAEVCHWEFWFDLQVPGDYTADAKVLLWRGTAPHDPKNITVTRNNLVPFQNYTNHAGFPGFEFEHAGELCSEICTRALGCVYWSTPALHYFQHGGCELYFNTSDETKAFQYDFPEVGVPPTEQSYELSTTAHGTPHGNLTSYFIGCGWSFWLNTVSPCLSGSSDDRVFMAENVITLPESEQQQQQRKDMRLPKCKQEEHEHVDRGRWMKEEYPPQSLCPEEYDTLSELDTKLKNYKILKHIPEHPHCWFRENISSLGEHCYDGGCAVSHKNRWKSPLQIKERWFGMWKNYDCDYLELMDEELQFCIDKRQIVSIRAEGGDNALFLRDYLAQRMKGIKFFDAEISGTPKEKTLVVTLNTLDSMHLLSFSRDEWKRQLESDIFPRPQAGEEHYWVEAMYLSSERKVYRNALRAQQFNQDAYETLKDKHYKKINAYNMSAAFTYDSAAQLDGMHIIGPPMRMIITKLFHYMCQDYVAH